MAVEVFTAQGDEELSCSDLAAVGRYAAERHIPGILPTDQRCGDSLRGFIQIHGDAHARSSRRAASAACAWVTSENGRRTPAIS